MQISLSTVFPAEDYPTSQKKDPLKKTGVLGMTLTVSGSEVPLLELWV